MDEEGRVKIEHIALNVHDSVEVVAWYVEYLGMKVVRSIDNDRMIRFVADSAGVSLIEFYNNKAVPVPDFAAMKPDEFHIAFSSANIEGDIARLVAGGASQDGSINQTPQGDRLAFLRDPWGICLQLAQRATPIL
jgi:catechol 2,3-dioxygenase-like lactoylglutathione lyase family enzyme